MHPASMESNGQSGGAVSRPPLHADGTGAAPGALQPGPPQALVNQGTSYVSRPLRCCPYNEMIRSSLAGQLPGSLPMAVGVYCCRLELGWSCHGMLKLARQCE